MTLTKRVIPMNNLQKTSAVGAMVLLSLSAIPAQAHLFSATELVAGYELSMAEATCGADKAKTEGAAGKTAEGKCGEGKCGEGKCGGDKAMATTDKAAEGKCGEAKCGADKAAPEKAADKATEGKCGGAF